MKKKSTVQSPPQLGDLKNQLARALADYQNLTKRTDAEKEVWFKYSAQKVLLKLLPVLDNLESAQKHLADQGLAIAISDFKNLFKEEGLEEIVPQPNDVFDHTYHEAVDSIPGGKTGEIAETLLTGWKFSEGKVIRFAKVKVFTGKNLN